MDSRLSGCCALCDRYASMLFGSWCWKCYSAFKGEARKIAASFLSRDPARAQRLERYQALAQELRPLFEGGSHAG